MSSTEIQTNDNMTIFLLKNGKYRGAILDACEMVTKMKKKHETGILETYALGETYIAAGLLTSMMKGRDRLAILFECGGPIKGINVEVTATGEVRGFLKNNPIPLSEIPESLDLSPLFGPGFLSITKYLEDSKQPFTGRVMITYGSIARDLAYYFQTSENIPTAFNLSVKFDKDGSVIGAGGIFIQKLPAADNEASESDDTEVAELEETLRAMNSIGKSFSEGVSAADILTDSFGVFQPEVIGSRYIRFKCSCSRELFSNYLQGLKKEDKQDLLENGPFPVVTICHNCNTEYKFSRKELEKLLN